MKKNKGSHIARAYMKWGFAKKFHSITRIHKIIKKVAIMESKARVWEKKLHTMLAMNIITNTRATANWNTKTFLFVRNFFLVDMSIVV